MSEALAILGTAASVVQVIDFGLRLSREAYTFLHKVKGSRKDIENASRTLRSVTSVLLDVKGYVEERRNDGSPIPESISNGLHILQTILIDMRSLLPNDCIDLGVYKQIKWVTDVKRLRQLSKQLHNGKSTLHMALSVAFQLENNGQYKSLRESQAGQVLNIGCLRL